MVRNYSKTTNRQEWSIDAMNCAIQSVINKEMGYYKASKQFNVPQTTLERHTKKKLEDPSYEINKKKGSKFQCVFSERQEYELVNYLLTMESRLFGLTMKELRSLAFQLAERNNVGHRFNSDMNMAGQDWVKNFLARHPNLTIREPETTSGARAMGFNKVSVDKFFDLLEKCIDKYHLTGEKIFNCDETGVTVNPKSQSKIIALKGKRQVGCLTSADRGETVTGLVCMSAAGAFMPVMLIFPRKRKQREFELGLPPGGWAEVSDSGWITTELFLVWLKKFAHFSKASKDSPVLLILDGHSTHTKSLDIIDFARDNGVVLLCLPPHTSHRLQPLDVTFFRPLSLYYGEELRKWLRCNPGKVVTLWQISSIFGSAFIQAATMRTAMHGFEASGIWPPNRNIFSDSDFLPAETTDVTKEPDQEVTSANVTVKSITTTDPHAKTTANETHSLPPETRELNVQKGSTHGPNVAPQPGCSWMPDQPVVLNSTNSAFPTASPDVLLPIPKTKCTKRTTRKKGKTAIITESPYKAELQAEKEKKEAERKAKAERKEIRIKKRLFSELELKSKTNKKQKLGRKGKGNIKDSKAEKIKKKKEAGSSDDEEDAECLYCGYFYSKSNEGWVSCVRCKNWAHNSCAGIDSEDDESILVCELCK